MPACRSRGQLGHGPPSPHGGNGNEVFPRLNMEMRRIKRHIHQVACGNNCTVLLVGRFRVPKLQEICVEALAKHSHLYQGTGAMPTAMQPPMSIDIDEPGVGC